MSEMLCPDIQVFHVDDPRFGIVLYRNALSEKAKNVVERLEATIGSSSTAPYMWMEALVGDQVKMPEYRDCHDCKIGKNHAENAPSQFSEIKNIYSDISESLEFALVDYEARYNIKMDYMEAINFVRYNPGEHFSVHTDHGFSYNCTVSSCLYLNDGYEGGELHFPHLNITIKPEFGDHIMFPSTYIYAHGSKPVISGTKYVAVTMFDYNDRTHKHGYGENMDGSKATEGAGIPQYSPTGQKLQESSYGRFGLNK
jgi:hypothetical protein